MAEEKMKILYLMRILLEETDQDHILNAEQLCQKMESRYSLTCNRKTIYSDIDRLKKYGLMVQQLKGDRQGYYVEDRKFSLPELKLLVDAVQVSKFITKTKSRELIAKLETLTSKENAKQLQRDVVIYNRVKTDNDAIYDNVDVIYKAIFRNRQICFLYCEWSLGGTLVPRKGGAIYEISPWALTWDDENYYMVGYDESAGKIKHYRIDKMKSVSISEKQRTGKENFENFDLASFASKTFGMFGGRDENVTLQCENSLVGVVYDRFGKDIMIKPAGEDYFLARVLVTVSRQFYGWLTAVGSGIQIVEPEAVRTEYLQYMKEITDAYSQ